MLYDVTYFSSFNQKPLSPDFNCENTRFACLRGGVMGRYLTKVVILCLLTRGRYHSK